MKIIAFMNSYSQGKSGGDVFFIEVAKRLKDYNKVIVTSLLGKALCQKFGLAGEFLITTREAEFREVIRTYIKRMIKAILLKIDTEAGDILLGTSDFLSDVLPIFWLGLKNRKLKWVQHVFHLIPSKRLIPFLAQRMSFLLIKPRADVIIVDNTLLKDELAELGFDPQKIFVNYPGIDLSYLRSVSVAEVGYDGIFMARLHPSKGIFDLVKIWKRVCEKRPGAKLGIIGKGVVEVERGLKALVKKEGLEKNIELLGYLEDGVAFATIKASKVFVFPSHEEGFGITPLEAQALGLPVVAWDLPPFGEIFPKGMVRVEIGGLEKFAAAVLSLLTNPSVHQKISNEALANASRFDWDKTAERELALIEDGKY